MSRSQREPTPDELAGRMEMPEDEVRKVLKIAKEPISMRHPSRGEQLRSFPIED